MDYSLLDDLTGFICDTTYNDLPAPVVEESIRIILDSIGCAFAGSKHKRGRIGMDFGRMQPGHEATILPTGQRVSIFGASFANAELINALDYDHILPPGHVVPYVLPPALATAQQIGSSGRDLILATAIAHELSNRIGKAMDYHRDVIDGKLSPPSVWGFASTVFGAAAGVSKLRGHDAGTVANALSLAGLTSPVNAACAWRDHWPPTTIKYGLAGGIANAGLTAAHMAELGHRGDRQVFDPKVGYPRFIGTRRWDPAATIKDLGTVWNFPVEGAFKPYPHCRVLHAPIDALISIIEANDIKPDEIEGITAWVEGILGHPLWQSREITEVTDAQFSIAHGLALAAHNIRRGPEWQYEDRVYSPSVLALMDKVEYLVHPDYVRSLTGDADARPTRVEVRARSQIFAEERTHPKGTSRPDSAFHYATDDLVNKFLVNASYVMPEEQALDLVERIRGLAELDDVNLMTAVQETRTAAE